jgi:hypothetical protein
MREELDVRVTQNGKSRNYIAFAAERLSPSTVEANLVVVLRGSGVSVAKVISVAEVVKTLVPGLHQLNELLAEEKPRKVATPSTGEDDSTMATEGEEATSHTVSVMRISLSKSSEALSVGLPRGVLLCTHSGYQAP